MIWAALENADTTPSSDCETVSPCVSTPVHVDTELEDTEEVPVPTEPVEPCHKNTADQPEPQETSPQELRPAKGENDGPHSPIPVQAQEEAPRSPGQVVAEEDSPQSPDPVECQVRKPESSQEEEAQLPVTDSEEVSDSSSQDVRKVTAVPHRSYFATGIVPFEDTPEYTEVAAATGTYLKIRDLLKSSPRSLGKKK